MSSIRLINTAITSFFSPPVRPPGYALRRPVIENALVMRDQWLIYVTAMTVQNDKGEIAHSMYQEELRNDH